MDMVACLFRTSPDSSASEVAAGAAGGSAQLLLYLAHPASFPFSPYPYSPSFFLSLPLSLLLSLPLTE